MQQKSKMIFSLKMELVKWKFHNFSKNFELTRSNGTNEWFDFEETHFTYFNSKKCSFSSKNVFKIHQISYSRKNPAILP